MSINSQHRMLCKPESERTYNFNISDFVVTSVHLINTDSLSMDANHAIVMKAVQRACSAMLPANVHATTMSKVDGATDAKRTSTIVIRDVWIVQIVTIWCVMQPTIIAANWPI